MHLHPACGVLHVTPATRLHELQALQSRHTRPHKPIVPIFTHFKRVQEDNSHSVKSYLCILRAWIPPSGLVTGLSLWGRDVPISWIAYSVNRKRTRALKICGMYEAPDQRFFRLLIHLKIFIQKYESGHNWSQFSKHRRRHESHKRAYFRPSQSSGSHSCFDTVKSTFSEMTSEG